jgi:outer membrane cobalamin receptor
LRLQLSSNADAILEIGDGFKLPSFFALAYPLIANPDLRPERGRTLSAGVDRRVSAGVIKGRLYDNRYIDLIDFDPQLLKNVNRSHVRSRGFELESELDLAPGVFSRLMLSYNQLRNEKGAPPLRLRPHWRGAAELVWNASRSWQFSLLSRLSSGSYDSSVATGLILLRGYATMDAAIEWHPSNHLRLQASFQNLTGERHQQVVGVRSGGRSASIAFILTV